MKTTVLQKQAIRDDILRAAKQMPRGIPVAMLQSTLSAMGRKFNDEGEDSLDAHLIYLKSSGLIEPVKKTHTPGLEVWQLTAAGVDYVDSL